MDRQVLAVTLPTLKKQFIKKKLTDISKGNVDADYRMRFPSRR